MTNVAKIIEREFKKYEERNFRVTALHADNAFDNDEIKNIIGPRTLHTYAREEHVGVVERQIRVIKERLRSVVHGLPYKKFPKLLFIGMMDHVTEMINRFPTNYNIPTKFSPAELIDGVSKIDLSHRQILFGSYAEVWDGTTNTMREREQFPAYHLIDRMERADFTS